MKTGRAKQMKLCLWHSTKMTTAHKSSTHCLWFLCWNIHVIFDLKLTADQCIFKKKIRLGTRRVPVDLLRKIFAKKIKKYICIYSLGWKWFMAAFAQLKYFLVVRSDWEATNILWGMFSIILKVRGNLNNKNMHQLLRAGISCVWFSLCKKPLFNLLALKDREQQRI